MAVQYVSNRGLLMECAVRLFESCTEKNGFEDLVFVLSPNKVQNVAHDLTENMTAQREKLFEIISFNGF